MSVARWPGKSQEALGRNARLDGAKLEDCPWNDEVGQHHRYTAWRRGWTGADKAIEKANITQPEKKE